MIIIKNPKPNIVRFKEIRFGDTFISSASDEGLYQKIDEYDSFSFGAVNRCVGWNAFNLATGLLAKFDDDHRVTLVDVVVEYSLRK